MKRLLTLTLIGLLVALAAAAQKGLGINELFDGRFRSDSDVKETIIKSSDLEDYDLTLYHSLTLTGKPDLVGIIEPLVSRDGTSASDREVSYRNGHLYYGFYSLRPKGDKNRYIVYLNQHPAGGNKIILIYLEGEASADKVKKMIKQ